MSDTLEQTPLFTYDSLMDQIALAGRDGHWGPCYPDWEWLPANIPSIWFAGRLYLRHGRGDSPARVVLTAPIPTGVLAHIAQSDGVRVHADGVEWVSWYEPTPEPVRATEDERGLFRKYDIRRRDGKDGPGHKHEKCAYFVLDLNHDPYAVPALKAYAEACKDDLPALAHDLLAAAAAEAIPEGPGIAAEHFMGNMATRRARHHNELREAIERLTKRVEGALGELATLEQLLDTR